MSHAVHYCAIHSGLPPKLVPFPGPYSQFQCCILKSLIPNPYSQLEILYIIAHITF